MKFVAFLAALTCKLHLCNGIEEERTSNSLIPRIIDSGLSRRVMGSLNMPEGSPWCNGRPMVWFTGHSNPEFMFCENSAGELDVQVTNPKMPSIDRHGCTAFDVNKDGIVDLLCTRGGSLGTATTNNNEVFLTQADGSLQQIFNHGLESPTRRSKDFLVFKSGTGDDLVFEQVRSNDRIDGLDNHNQLYKWVPQKDDGKYFVKVPGPWEDEEIYPLKVEMADFDGDGKLDIFIHAGELSGQKYEHTIRIYVQRKGNRFYVIKNKSNFNKKEFDVVAVADINGDGQPDIVGYHGDSKTFYVLWNISRTSRRNIFFETSRSPFKSYRKDYGIGKHKVGGMAVLDVNGDGLLDIFVTQSLNEPGVYCDRTIRGGYAAVRREYGIVRRKQDWEIEANWVPPSNGIPELLFVNEGIETSTGYPVLRAEELNLNLKGCAAKFMDPFGDKKLAINYGQLQWPGRSYILDWSQTEILEN